MKVLTKFCFLLEISKSPRFGVCPVYVIVYMSKSCCLPVISQNLFNAFISRLRYDHFMWRTVFKTFDL